MSEVVYGRKVGYKIRKIKLSKKIENISVTMIRKKLNKWKKLFVQLAHLHQIKSNIWFKKYGVDIFRINLSHTSIHQLPEKINFLKKIKLKIYALILKGLKLELQK